jgi:hypothetical protein
MTCSVISPSAILTPSIAPSAARMPQRICAASKAGPAGAAVAKTRSLEPSAILAAGADVDEQPRALVARDAGGQQARDDVAADIGAERWEDEGRCARVDAHPEVGGQRRWQLVRGDDEGGHRQRLGVDAEREVHHRRVAAGS